MRIRGAIFDMDGTLLDSMHIWQNFGKAYLRSKGIDPEEKLRERLAPMTLTQAAEVFRKDYGIKDPVPKIERDVNLIVEDEYFNLVQPKEGIPEMLEAFYAAGVKMCVATVTDKYLAEAAFKRTGLLKYFEDVFTCGELGVSKSDPEIFETALRSLGTKKEETAVFEDSWYAIRTAKASGFPVVAVNDRHSYYCEDEIRGLADIYLETVPEWRSKLVI